MIAFFYQYFGFLMLPLLSGNNHSELATFVNPHPFYISVTEINHNAGTKSLEISCKFFSDDLEQTLEKAYKAQLDITLPKDKAAFDKYIPDYIAKHFSVVVDGRSLPLTYVGFEKDKESAFAYFEIGNVGTLKQMTITNSLLHDFTSQQINIMHVTVNGKRQSTKLDYPETKAAFGF
ncbi:MAG: hypothetical protein M3Y85_12460 [Bacteroidota bacterium]|nr:hypothetical protein [Bacteroidota bacterium]